MHCVTIEWGLCTYELVFVFWNTAGAFQIDRERNWVVFVFDVSFLVRELEHFKLIGSGASCDPTSAKESDVVLSSCYLLMPTFRLCWVVSMVLLVDM